MIEPAPEQARNDTPRRACLLAGPDQQGVIAIFRGGKNERWIADAWEQLRRSIVFPQEQDPPTNDTPIARQLEAGAQLAKRLAGGESSTLLAETKESSWLSYLDTPDQPLAWWRIVPSAGAVDIESRYRPSPSVVRKVLYSARGTDDFQSYRASVESSTSQDAPDVHPAELRFERDMRFDAVYKASTGKIDLSVRPVDGKPAAERVTVPPNFVPGAWLSQLIGKLKLDRAITLRTDSLLGYELLRPSGLLTVTIWPDSSQAAARTSDDGQALGCIAVEVSGSGNVDRWYLRSDGTVDHIETWMGIRTIPRDTDQIISDFSNDQRMRP
jgi:hypothetical protein